jgi:hypothetical protein
MIRRRKVRTQRLNNSQVVTGSLLIMLGVVFLIATLGVAGLSWGTIWPLFIMLVGLGPIMSMFVEKYDNPKQRALPIMISSCLLMLGLFFFATTLNYVTWEDQGRLWPVYIIIIGSAALVGYFVSGLSRYGYLATGMLLLLMGGSFLAATLSGFFYDINWVWFDNIDRWFDADWAAQWWPLFPIVFGLALLVISALSRNVGARSGPAVMGTILLLVGIFFQVTTLRLISWEDQGRLWPIYPLIVAVASLVGYFVSGGEYKAFLVPAAICGVVGLVFLPATLINESLAGQVWPLFLILAGVLLLITQRSRHVTR